MYTYLYHQRHPNTFLTSMCPHVPPHTYLNVTAHIWVQTTVYIHTRTVFSYTRTRVLQSQHGLVHDAHVACSYIRGPRTRPVHTRVDVQDRRPSGLRATRGTPATRVPKQGGGSSRRTKVPRSQTRRTRGCTNRRAAVADPREGPARLVLAEGNGRAPPPPPRGPVGRRQ